MTEDERTIANKLAREEKREKEADEDSEEVALQKKDPTALVSRRQHYSSISYHLQVFRPSRTATSPAEVLRSTRRSPTRRLRS